MAENSRRRWRRMAIIAAALVAGVALVLLGAVVLLLVSDRLPPRTAPWYDYSALLQVLSDSATLRYPTAQELKGFPVLWPTVPVDKNAAFYYAKAVRLLKWKGDPDGASSSGQPYAGDMAALEAWVAANKPALDMAIEAQSHSVCRMPIFISTATGTFIPNGYPNPCPNCLSSLRQLGRCFSDAGLAEQLNGRPHAAAERYLACLRMGAQIRSGVTIQSLIGYAILSNGATPLDRLVANSVLPDDDLRRIIQVCSEAETRPGEIADSLECETEYSTAYFRVGGLRAKIAKHLLDAIRGGRRAIEAARKDAELPVYQVINNPNAQLAVQYKPVDKLNEEMAQFWQWRARLARMDTDLRVLQIRAAIALYQRQHGSLPETLDALCPEFLPKVPLDPFSGKPLRYRASKEGWVQPSVDPDLTFDALCPEFTQNPFSGQPEYHKVSKEGWAVWSVGPDLTDDGGKDSLFMAALGSNWNGKDGVFVSDVQSAISRIRSSSTGNMSSSAEDRDMAALAAKRAAHPEVDPLGLTPLHHAANRGDLAAVEALLTKGADVNARGLAKQTPLHLAVTKEIAQRLISKGAHIEARDNRGRTPLFLAAGAGRKEVVEALLADGAQADAPEVDDTARTALMSDFRSQLPAKMQAAIPATQSRRTPITYAAEQGHDDIADLLRKYLAEHPVKQ